MFCPVQACWGGVDQNFTEDIELLGFGDVVLYERLNGIVDGDLPMGIETDGSISSIMEFTLFPEVATTNTNSVVLVAPWIPFLHGHTWAPWCTLSFF